MRQRIPILFILALLLPFVGVYGWLKFEKSAVRKSVKHRLMEGIPKDELVQFSFANEDTLILLDWKHSMEFEYRGEMYDIVTRYYTEDSVTYDLWWDHEETELNRKLASLTNNLINQNPAEQSKTGYLTFVIRSMYCVNDQFHFNAPFEIEQLRSIYINQQVFFKTRTIPPISPPPRKLV